MNMWRTLQLFELRSLSYETGSQLFAETPFLEKCSWSQFPPKLATCNATCTDKINLQTYEEETKRELLKKALSEP